ncbi:MAG: flagellar hook-length control protein FliK [Aromatoleum sp.]|uniref:flagellar hook-length control protein FliK n=1 Tax=Aromatoleum sp. TaxID=2307007 RepID=UPI002894A9C4|nr:flagellar hook-length control protein FliK [Aromatoleum sp.]MDT3671881.1 flagellar hook-length control protein FliK [Aromatoleum sp.]
MCIDRIPAVPQTPHARPRADDGRGPPTEKGDMLRLAFERAAGDDVLVADGRGFALRLAGLARQAREFVPGDVLLLRVLATAPRLELEFLGTSTTPRNAANVGAALAGFELAAMRLDQTVVPRISWLLPDTGALATTWYLKVRDAGRSAGATTPMLPPPSAAPDAPATALQLAFERWAVPVFAWGGLPAQLRFVPIGVDEGSAPRRAARAIALRIELALPGLGAVSVQAVVAGGTVRLALTAERTAALTTLHDALPAITDALAAAGLLLADASVAQETTPVVRAKQLTAAQALHLASIAAALTPGPFRAVAEVVVVLLSAALAAAPGPTGG